ncbi:MULTISPECIES: helix-turn-helix transcriptional regulator [unclassified Rathayibacter]|uniref:helix-turn-helix transcriptional regulator n=1 Tax=unclassified Rathayibacter TaxID=2609250 RepID=UPI0006F64F6C|nr:MULTISPECIES: helix-turn-helix transcriptional regulator [unclassified Rathayibacter]KQQ03478.1 XRE family transcriptional regulator [Rathayibacter sp. Leaf294]KQS11934.1 XRE family transcriptional regulator [Rathayibacter sp. Leaf185]
MSVNDPEARDFLVSRRARLTPEQVDLPLGGGARRVPGLRRSEVAQLAGVSIEYYSRLERGDLRGASEGVLDALARALRLDEAERAHLLDLARAAGGSPVRRRARRPVDVRPGLQLALDSITAGPAFMRNGRLDVLAENALFRALYGDLYERPERPVNLARFTFLQRELSERFHSDWEAAADISVGILRTEAGRDPGDVALQTLIGELSTRSDEFRRRWGAHDVRHHASGSKFFHHPVVGDLHLVYEALEPMNDPGLNFLIYSAEPGSPSADALSLLASWWATREAASVASASVAEGTGSARDTA